MSVLAKARVAQTDIGRSLRRMGSAPSQRYVKEESAPVEKIGKAQEKFAKQRHEAIERNIAEEKLRLAERKTLKILLLGGPASGKSTVFKQMRILHMNGFTSSDYINYKYLIRSNTVHALQQILAGCRKFDIRFSETYQEDLKSFEDFLTASKYNDFMTEETGAVMFRLWRSKPAQKCVNLLTDSELMDSGPYFLESVRTISQFDYVPSVQDILRSRSATNGISEIHFEYRDSLMRMFDVGGQKSEQRKWIHCFDNVHAVLFICALSAYDQQIEDESEATNSVENSLAIFKKLMDNPVFLKTSIILFLNKMDIFKQKIRKTPLKLAFPDYKGENSVEQTCAFIEKKFKYLMPDQKKLYNHFTVATDTDNVDKVFEVCMDVVFTKTLQKLGVY